MATRHESLVVGMKPSVLALLLGLVAALGSRSAAAYCRATTCDPEDPKQQCVVHQQTKCTLSGQPLAWKSGCITVNIQENGAPKSRISPRAAAESVARAFDTWLGVDCGGGARPSLDVVIGGPVSCSVPEFSTDHHNANIVMFREDSWPYPGGNDSLGITWLSFDADTGELWDADIELNAATESLSVGEPDSDQIDLDSLITHEVGHLLGLGHSLVTGATMEAGYFPGSIELRSPEADDVAGLCAIYPPSRAIASSNCEPRFGFSALCASDQPPFVPPPKDDEPEPPPRSSDGCSLSGPARAPSSLLVLSTLIWLASRRRRCR